MQCLRCGYCCCFYDVIIIIPAAINDLGEADLDNPESFGHKKSGEACPHLRWEGDIASCRIHDLPWYSETPCFDFTQIEESIDSPCRLGEYNRSKNVNILERLKLLKNVEGWPSG